MQGMLGSQGAGCAGEAGNPRGQGPGCRPSDHSFLVTECWHVEWAACTWFIANLINLQIKTLLFIIADMLIHKLNSIVRFSVYYNLRSKDSKRIRSEASLTPFRNLVNVSWALHVSDWFNSLVHLPPASQATATSPQAHTSVRSAQPSGAHWVGRVPLYMLLKGE